MRKTFALVLLIGLIFFGCTGPAVPEGNGTVVQPEAPAARCSEGEGALDRMIKGTVVFNEVNYADMCQDSASVREYYCSGDELASKVVDCGQGYECSDGACVPVHGPEENMTADTCNETDGGKDYYRAGTTTLEEVDYTDVCQGNYDMIEYYCEGGEWKQETHHCKTGERCIDGACVPLDQTCSETDADDENMAGVTTLYGGGMVVETMRDSCLSYGTKREYYCDSAGIAGRDVGCEAGEYCHDGACIPPCKDMDSGKDADTASYAKDRERTYYDYCRDNETLYEYYCSGEDAMRIEMPCDAYCYEGRCIKQSQIDCRESGELVRLFYGGDIIREEEDYCEDYMTMMDYFCISEEIEYDHERCEEDEICDGHECIKITEAECYDLDAEDDPAHVKSYAVKTTNTSVLDTREDECLNYNTVKEYTCVDGNFGVDFLECPGEELCRNGACTYPYVCRETDGGQSLEPGSASIYDDYGKLKTTSEDGCADDNTVMDAYCTEDNHIGYARLNCPEGTMCDSTDGSCR